VEDKKGTGWCLATEISASDTLVRTLASESPAASASADRIAPKWWTSKEECGVEGEAVVAEASGRAADTPKNDMDEFASWLFLGQKEKIPEMG
jgi:hypothetical protein